MRATGDAVQLPTSLLRRIALAAGIIGVNGGIFFGLRLYRRRKAQQEFIRGFQEAFRTRAEPEAAPGPGNSTPSSDWRMLKALILNQQKYGSSSLVAEDPDYVATVQVGDLEMLLNHDDGLPYAIVMVTKVDVVKYSAVHAFAAVEGEGGCGLRADGPYSMEQLDGFRAHWRVAHEEFFLECALVAGLSMTAETLEDEDICCVTFQLLWTAEGTPQVCYDAQGEKQVGNDVVQLHLQAMHRAQARNC